MHATAVAPSNIAFVKYWGNTAPSLRLPYNASISMTLSGATSRTSVTFSESLESDEVVLDGVPATEDASTRVSDHLDLIRRLAGVSARARVESSNSIPMGTGIASSASGFAALTMAGCAATGLSLSERELSALARRGSGSASRSIPDGFVVWHAGADDAASFAESIAPPEHWDLLDIVAIVSREHKTVGSGGGHDAASLNPFFTVRQAHVTKRLEVVREALLSRDLQTFGEEVEAESYELHAIAMTSKPPILYWTPGTVALLHLVRAWRADGVPVYATLDAGPNVHLICESSQERAITQALDEMDYVESYIVNHAAAGARVITE